MNEQQTPLDNDPSTTRLPIEDRWDEIVELIRNNQVVVVAGETGSGKSTKLPLICLDAGLGAQGLIGHTQPRRIAARSIAARIASEIDEDVGERVGFAVRFSDQVGPKTVIKLVTDGILLAEIQRDRTLSKYEAIIIDEAHERSLNIDFLLGYLKSLLPRRPDLKVIITSATIDTERFAKHFDAPSIEITGRTFPVEVRYRPIEDQRSISESVTDAVQELIRTENGDILVFANGEREIREAIEAIDGMSLRDTEAIPLFARLTPAEQQRIFSPHSGRRVVVSTNVAETSLTVPGIRSVIDIGTARISRYSRRTKVQRLPIEPISQASANQRAGRCGRVAPGVCIRLYAEDDFWSRPEFTEPEIQRTNLASVILQMATIGLGDIDQFPFLDPPDSRSITDGINLLEELDAIDPEQTVGSRRWLTPLGRQLGRMPIDPRLARMVLAAVDFDCVAEVLVIVSALSIQDPRDRPSEKREEASAAHGVYANGDSDFLTLLNLWDRIETMRRELSGNQFRRRCRSEFLNFNRIREWQDVERQLRRTLKTLKIDVGGKWRPHADGIDKSKAEAVHRALLFGLISQLGMREKKKSKKATGNNRTDGKRQAPTEFIGARNTRFAIAPGSALRRTSASWLMAAELVETNRLWARIVAPVEAAWIEDAAEHLATYRYDTPLWDSGRGTATTIERATLYGLPIVEGRTINLRRVDVPMARELFIHHALIDGELSDTDGLSHRPFVSENAAVLNEVAALEARARTRDLVDEREALFEFYDRRLGQDVTSIGHFNRWWKKAESDDARCLHLSVGDLVDVESLRVDGDDYPESWTVGSLDLAVSYEFDPASPIDGVIVDVPIDVLNQLDGDLLAWNVPGFRSEIYDHLARSLPKSVRKQLLPIADSIEQLERRIVERVDTSSSGLGEAVSHELGRLAGTTILPADLDVAGLPNHLRPTIRVIDRAGAMVGAGKHVEVLRRRLDDQIRTSLQQADFAHQAEGLTAWTIGDLPQSIETGAAGNVLKAFPSLVDETDSVSVRLLPTVEEQDDAMWTGIRRLLRFEIGSLVRRLDRMLSNDDTLTLAASIVQSKAGWYDDIVTSALDDLMTKGGAPVWSAEAFDALVLSARSNLDASLRQAGTGGVAVARAGRRAGEAIEQRKTVPALAAAVADETAHLARLLYPGVATGVGSSRLVDVARYLEAIAARLDAGIENAGRDRDRALEIRSVESAYAALVARAGLTPDLEELAWDIEELRVSLFAVKLGVNGKVSAKRIRRRIADLGGQLTP